MFKDASNIWTKNKFGTFTCYGLKSTIIEWLTKEYS